MGTSLKEIKSANEIKSVQPSPAEPKPVDAPQTQKILKKEYYDSIRRRGIPELVSTNSRDRYEHHLKEVKAIAKHVRITCNVTDLKRLGKYQEGKSRTLVAEIDSDYAIRLILLSLAKMKDYGKPVFISKKLNPSEQAIKNEILETRREMIKTGTNLKKLRIRNLVLQIEDNRKGTNVHKRKCHNFKRMTITLRIESLNL